MADLIEVVIDSLRVSLTNQQRIVILKAAKEEHYLPIWVGPFEAEAITIALQEIEVARPQTHDLLNKIFQLLKANLQKVIISSLKDDVFFATIVAEADGNLLEIDARPSDAIALALRAHIPILVDRKVMDEAAIEPEEEEESTEAENGTNPAVGESKADESTPKKRNLKDGRLSVFEDYLKKRKTGKGPGTDETPKKDIPDDKPKPTNN
jgi:bifunctional DNase/RNase